MPADWTSRVVASPILEPLLYTLVTEDVLAVQGDRLMGCAEGLGAYYALFHWAKFILDERFHGRG